MVSNLLSCLLRCLSKGIENIYILAMLIYQLLKSEYPFCGKISSSFFLGPIVWAIYFSLQNYGCLHRCTIAPLYFSPWHSENHSNFMNVEILPKHINICVVWLFFFFFLYFRISQVIGIRLNFQHNIRILPIISW